MAITIGSIWPLISNAYEIAEMRSMFSTVTSVGDFFLNSALRREMLERVILNKMPEAQHKRLKLLCNTRWIERHDSLVIFDELYMPQ